MGSKSDEFKELKWRINSLKIKLDSFNDREAYTGDGKDPYSSKK